MEQLHLIWAWSGILLGMVTGAGIGLAFHREGWLGGYGSWERRMVRLGHISLFGLGALNLGFALTVAGLGSAEGLVAASWCLRAGTVGMPLICFLSAWRKACRHLFFIPAGSLLLGAASTLWEIL